jgi:hypothetical protein
MKSLRQIIVVLLVLSIIAANAQEYRMATIDTSSLRRMIILSTLGINIQLKNLDDVYLSAMEEGSLKFIAGPAGECETFSLYDLNGGELVSGDSIRIKTCKGNYIYCDEKRNFSIGGEEVTGYDLFTVHKTVGKGNIEPNDGVIFKSSSGLVVNSLRCLQNQVTRATDNPCYESVFIYSIVKTDETADSEAGAVKRSILPNGHVQLIYPDGIILEKYPGGFTKTYPDGRTMSASFASAQPPTLPPAPDPAEEPWLDSHNGYLLNFIKLLVGNDEESIKVYLDSEAGMSGVYEKMSKRTETINYLLSP